jgi:hypothetical protein
MIRLRALVNFAKSTNITCNATPLPSLYSFLLIRLADDFLDTTLWSMIEIYVGIICVCMPSLKLSFELLCPKILRSIHASTSKYTGSGRTGGNIAVRKSVKVSCSTRLQTHEQGSIIELVKIVGDARSTQTDEESQGETHSIKRGQSPE